MFFNKVKNNIFIQALIKLIKEDGIEHAGYLSYLNIFSLFPLCIILSIIIAGVAGKEFSVGLMNVIISHVPNYSTLVSEQIQSIINGPSAGMLSFVFIGAIWTATSLLEGIRGIFNKIYKVRTPPFFVKSRFLSLLQFMLILAGFICVIFGLIIIPKILKILESTLDLEPGVFHIIQYNLGSTASIAIVFVLVAMLYYYLTNKEITIKSVIPGSIITTILWVVSVKFMKFFIEHQLKQLSFVYGSLSGILSVLIFFYVINIILLYGAAFNYLCISKLKS